MIRMVAKVYVETDAPSLKLNRICWLDYQLEKWQKGCRLTRAGTRLLVVLVI
jgi:hypothetical protein